MPGILVLAESVNIDDMANKFLIDNLSQASLPIQSSDKFIVERSDHKTYKVGAYSLAGDELSNHLFFAVSRSQAKGNNVLDILYADSRATSATTSVLLQQISLQDGILSTANFNSTTNVLSLFFNSTNPQNAVITVDLGSLHDVYKSGNGISIDDNTLSINVVPSYLTSYYPPLSTLPEKVGEIVLSTETELQPGWDVQLPQQLIDYGYTAYSEPVYTSEEYAWTMTVQVPDAPWDAWSYYSDQSPDATELILHQREYYYPDISASRKTITRNILGIAMLSDLPLVLSDYEPISSVASDVSSVVLSSNAIVSPDWTVTIDPSLTAAGYTEYAGYPNYAGGDSCWYFRLSKANDPDDALYGVNYESSQDATYLEFFVDGIVYGNVTCVKEITYENALGLALTSDLATKLNSTSIAPDFLSTESYPVNSYVTKDGNLYKAISAHAAGAWSDNDFTAIDMTEPEATLNIDESRQALQVVSSDGSILWDEMDNIRYSLLSAPALQLVDRAINKYVLSSVSAEFIMPDAIAGKALDFIVDVSGNYNPSATISFRHLDTNYSMLVRDGESLADMTTVLSGEMARFLVTQTGFEISAGKPSYLVMKNVVVNGGA